MYVLLHKRPRICDDRGIYNAGYGSQKLQKQIKRFFYIYPICILTEPQALHTSATINLEYDDSTEESAGSDHSDETEGYVETSRSTLGVTSTAAGAGSGRASGASRSGGSSRLAGFASEVRAITLETRTLTGTVIHELHSLAGDSREGGALDLPLVRLRRALGSLTILLEATSAGGVSSLLVSISETLEILVGRDFAIAPDLDKTVTVRLNGVFVSETTRVDTGHVGGIESRDLAPLAGVGDAAKLRQEDGLAVIAVGLDLLVPSRLGKRRGVAPGVVVEGKEVGALIVSTAVEVESLELDVLGNISGRVSDRNDTVVPVGDVLLHVTSNSLDVRSSVGVVLRVDDLISREEEEQVVVVGKCVDGSKDGLQVHIIVRTVEGVLVLTVERVVGRVGIERQVDTGVVEHLHTLIVVLRVVDGVDTDSVDTE